MAVDAGPPSSPVEAWAFRYAGDIQIDGMGCDERGDVYTAGYFVGRVELDASHVLESVVDDTGAPTKDIYVAKHGRGTGALEWVRHFGGAGREGNVYDIVVGSDGTAVSSGAFSGTVDFDGRVLTSTVAAGGGSASSGTYGNMFAFGLDGSGAVRWATQATGDVVSGGNEIAVDPTGGYVQVGMFGGADRPGGTLTIGAHDLAFEGGWFDTYVTRLSTAGEPRWLAHIGGNGAQRGKGVVADAQGNIVVVGDAWNGETRFGPGDVFVSDKQDFWVAKYAPDGQLMWSRHYGSEGSDEVKGVGVDGEGNVIVAASIEGSSVMLGTERIEAERGAGETGIVFALSADGARVLWTNTISSVERCCELEVDARGHIFVTTSAHAPLVRFGRGSSSAVGGSTVGGLLVELDATGSVVQSWAPQGEAGALGELSLLPGGSVAVTGWFRGQAMSLGEISLAGTEQRTEYVLVVPR